ncbi:hypothetical protein GCM10028801_11370 [Nocardioides maradonensis]
MTSRRLGASEAYYWLLDHLWPVNLLAVVDVDAPLADVEAAWAATVAALPVLRARIVGTDVGATLSFDGGAIAAEVGASGAVLATLARFATERIDLARQVARCCLLPRPGGTSVVVAVHHAVLDGRGMTQVAQVLGAALAGAEAGVPLRAGSVSLEEATSHVDAKARRRELLGVARRMRTEEEYVDNAGVLAFHDAGRDAERDVGFARIGLDAAATAGLVARARSIGATVQGLLSVAVLRACAELSPATAPVALSTAVDLRTATGVAPEAPVGQAGSLIAGSYDVALPDDDLARVVSADVRRRVRRGEGELLFTLTNADHMAGGPAADDVVRRWMSGVTPAFCVSNVGVVDAPASAVRALAIGLAPSPNQVAFLLAATYDGVLSALVGFDRSRLSVDGSALAAAIEGGLVAMATPSASLAAR